MRGEHKLTLSDDHSRLGSPPHARGTPSTTEIIERGEGITPACAGNTVVVQSPNSIDRDHPRMRGEHWIVLVPPSNYPGSPPHARGTPFQECYFNPLFRITPACAGNTLDKPLHLE